MRRLWTEDVFSFDGEYHRFEHASILPRPAEPIPVLFGGSAPALLDRCARLGDGWIPLGSPNDKSAERIAELRRLRAAAGKPWDGFEIRAQAQYGGGTPDRWRARAKWEDARRHPHGDRDAQRRPDRRRRPPRPHRRVPHGRIVTTAGIPAGVRPWLHRRWDTTMVA
jgi:alkanesulfonate monooxygenase SsuD/methylene tetrahydromethanopterin reductase-like flavin-dependent oxidoreductase (luciferase family)